MSDWDWDQIGLAIIAVVVIAFATLGVIALAAPHNVDYYYLSKGGMENSGQATCVQAHWTWHTDEISYCTNDAQQALDFVTKANASLKH